MVPLILLAILFPVIAVVQEGGRACEEACGEALRNQDAVRANLRVTELTLAVERQTTDLKAAFNSWTEGPASKLILLFFTVAASFVVGIVVAVARNPVKFACAWSILVGGVIVLAPPPTPTTVPFPQQGLHRT
jgi:hypothetical protein